MNHRDLTRIRAFRQLKSEIRNSERHLIVGVDIAKDRHHAFFGTPYGVTIHRNLVFENTRQGFEKLLETTRIHSRPNGLYKLGDTL